MTTVTSAVAFQQVSFCYGAHRAVDRVDMDVPAGALFGLLGPNGAGKSTCLNIITTLLVPTSGSVCVCGLDVVVDGSQVKQRIGYAPEEPLVYSGLTPREFAELSGRLHGLSARDAGSAAIGQIEALGLADRADDPISTFSKGMRRKAMLAAALAHDPEVLVLDEPLEGLDVFAQDTLKRLLRARVAEGKTVIYSSHTIEVVEGLCTHVGLLSAGSLVISGPIQDVKRGLGIVNLIDAFHGTRVDAPI